MFEALVKEGAGLQRNSAASRMQVNDMTPTEVSARLRKPPAKRLAKDRLETVFEERVGRAVGRLGVPTMRHPETTERVEELTKQVQKLNGSKAARRLPLLRRNQRLAKPAAKKSA